MVLYQAGAIPYRFEQGWELLMVTSRSSGRWIFPKGCIDPGDDAEDTAAQEALEEAGAIGNLEPPVGFYRSRKWGRNVQITLFPLRVTLLYDSWLEQEERQRQWFSFQEAAEVVDSDLLPLLQELQRRLPG